MNEHDKLITTTSTCTMITKKFEPISSGQDQNTHLIPRMGKPVDVAEIVCFLASPESSFVNGAVWTIDGGSLAWRGTNDMLGMEA